MLTLSSSTIHRYVPAEEQQKPADQQAFFLLKPLTKRQAIAFIAMMEKSGVDMSAGVGSVATAALYDAMAEIMSVALVGWGNVISQSGEAIPFNEADRKANIELIPFQLFQELSSELMEISHLTDKESKN